MKYKDIIRVMKETIDCIIPFPDTFADAMHVRKLIHSLPSEEEIAKRMIERFREYWDDGSWLIKDPHLKVFENWLSTREEGK